MRTLPTILLVLLVLHCTAKGQDQNRAVSTSPLWMQIEDPSLAVPYDLKGTILQLNPPGWGYHKYRIEFSDRSNAPALENKSIDFTFTVRSRLRSAPSCTVQVTILKGEIGGHAEVLVPVPEQLYDIVFETHVNGRRIAALCSGRESTHIPYYVRSSTVLIGDETDSQAISDASGLMLEETSVEGVWSNRIRVLDSYTINKPPQSYVNSNFTETQDLRFALVDGIPEAALEWSTVSNVFLSSKLLRKLTDSQSQCLEQFVRNSGFLVIYGDATSDKLIEECGQWFDPDHQFNERNWQMIQNGFNSFSAINYGLGHLAVLPDMPIELLLRKDEVNRYLSGKQNGVNLSNSARNLRQQSFWNWYLTRLGQPPVAAFAILIALFAGALAPALLYYCLRANRTIWLLVFFPVIAIAGTVALFFFAVLNDGFDTHTRVRSLTLLDKNSGQGVCVTRQVIFSGLAPKQEITFDQKTEAWPIDQSLSRNRDQEGGRIHWVDDRQVFDHLIRPREQFQFATCQCIKELRPFEWVRFPTPSIKDPSVLECEIKNLLEDTLAIVVISDGIGNSFSVENVGPMANATMHQIDLSNATIALAAMEETQPLALPKGLSGGQPRGLIETFLGAPNSSQMSSLKNPSDVILDVNQRLIRNDYLSSNRCFFVYPKQARYVDRALEETDEQDSLHMICGLWEIKP